MSTEDLLRPRYKVIANYPGNDVNVGFIFEPNVDWPESYLNKYPHLFQKLAWFEERKKEEMPVYVKHWKNNEVFKIVSIDWRYMSVFLHDDTFPRSFVNFIPATETEYNEYLKQLK